VGNCGTPHGIDPKGVPYLYITQNQAPRIDNAGLPSAKEQFGNRMAQAARMEVYHPLIAREYNWFQQLIRARKELPAGPIVLRPRFGQPSWLSTALTLHCLDVEDQLTLEIEQNRYDPARYTLAVFSATVGPRPVISFHSGCPAYRNRQAHLPLEKQRVTSPYFYSFDQQGLGYAFKTVVVDDPKKGEALRDLNLGLANFCVDCNIRAAQNAAFPRVDWLSPELPFAKQDFDPLAGVKFDR
jgi:hypothetical protein